MNSVFLAACLLVFLACDSRRRGTVATMALGLAFVVFMPASGILAYWQHIAIELSILISLYINKSPRLYKALFFVALFTHIYYYTNYGALPVPQDAHTTYTLILSVIYTLFLIILTKAECGLFSWWPPTRKKRKARWLAKEMPHGRK